MRNRPKTIIALAAALALASTASAETVKCKKADGSAYVGSSPPADCAAVEKTLDLSAGASATNADQLRSDAIRACRKGIESDLKSPGSAVWEDESKIEATHKGGSRYVMTLRVDSQNSMGGLMRSYLFCDAEFLGSAEGWRADISKGFAPR